MKIIALDLETIRSPQEVGWANHGALGVSVLCIVDVLKQLESPLNEGIYIFTEPVQGHADEIMKLMNSADVIVTHNGLAFDLRVLEFELGCDLREYSKKVIDFAFIIYQKHRVRVSLENLMRSMFGRKFSKFLSGELVCEYWASGDEVKRQMVIDHCVLDVLWLVLIFFGMIQDTVYKRNKAVAGRVKFLNYAELQSRREGKIPSRRIFSSCLIPYSEKLSEWVTTQPRQEMKKSIQFTFNHIIHKLLGNKRPPRFLPVPLK